MYTIRLSIASWLLVIATIGTTLSAYQQAIIIQPVVDLIGFSFCKEYNLTDSLAYYQEIPICAKSGRYGCPRLQQLLYNEQVTIIEAYEDEVRIEVSHLFFQTTKDDTQHIGYWTHKRNVMPLAMLKKKNVDLETIPKPISFIGNNKIDQDVAKLLEPYHDPITNRIYSAGTRFVRAHNTWSYKNDMPIYALQPRTLKPVVIYLPKKSVLINAPTTPTEQQELFVSILKDWAHQHKGFIPYAWGGCSFTGTVTDATFTIKTRQLPDGVSDYYQWPHTQVKSFSGFETPRTIEPITGLDCTGLIARAAQLAGMPYYFKNTTTLARNMRTLKPGGAIEPGDLIWFSGHVLVVADTKHHTAIEARGYDHGFGKIQELSLKKLFDGIQTYQQLADAFFASKPLKRLNAQGVVAQTVPSFKILKMASIWPELR